MTPPRVYETPRCPACGSRRWEPARLGEAPLRRCEACSVVYAPEYADPDDLYVEGYFFGGTDSGIDVTDPVFQTFLAEAATKRMRLIEAVSDGPGTMLDVGCGSGEVLAVAGARGWKGIGVEPLEQSARYAVEAHGVDVRATRLEESGLPERSFDVVSAFHVVEHMTDATEFLRLIKRWARPGGLVAVEVPNWRSVHRRSAGADWIYLRPLEHIAHYTPDTLAATLRRAGLEPILVRTPGFLSSAQMLDHQLNDLGIHRGRRFARALGQRHDYNGKTMTRTRPPMFATLRGIQYLYDRARVGQVVFAVARVSS
jgi:SAM-dependent methyltransferase